MATTVTLKSNAIDISGSTSGTTTLQATAVAGTTTITLPAATDTLVGKATTDTLTNKTLTSPTISSLTSASATALTLQSAGTTAVTIDTSQNVGIGTSSPNALLHVSNGDAKIRVGLTASSQYTDIYRDSATGLTIYNAAQAASFRGHVWQLGGVEAARIDSSGNLLVGTTTSDARVRASGTATVARFVADGGSYTGNIVSADTSGTAAGTGFNLILLQAGGANQFRVRGDGTIYAQNTSVQSISDARVKENIKNSTEGLEVVNALRPVRFDYKKGFGNNRTNQLGFIAQEVEVVFPDAVDVAGETDEQGNPYKSFGAGALIPVLVKAIQEQQALITTLTARITALENK